MIIGTYIVPGIEGKYVCKNTQEAFFTDIGDYAIWSNTLMPNIPFEESNILPEQIDETIFINAQGTEVSFEATVNVQNFLTTKYVGRAPLEYYGDPTEIGREFTLLCTSALCEYDKRVFGTEDAIDGYNREANENIQMPK